MNSIWYQMRVLLHMHSPTIFLVKSCSRWRTSVASSVKDDIITSIKGRRHMHANKNDII